MAKPEHVTIPHTVCAIFYIIYHRWKYHARVLKWNAEDLHFSDFSLTLGTHAQRGLQYLVCHSVCLSVCYHVFCRYAQQDGQ